MNQIEIKNKINKLINDIDSLINIIEYDKEEFNKIKIHIIESLDNSLRELSEKLD